MAFEFGINITLIGVACVFSSLLVIGITCAVLKKIFEPERIELERMSQEGKPINVASPKSRSFMVELNGKSQIVKVEEAGFIGEKPEDFAPKLEIANIAEIMVDGKVFRVKVHDVGDALYSLEPTAKSSQIVKEKVYTETCAVRAPVPGTILRILVKVGDKVKRGEVVVVMEAMKMENEILSPVTGTIKAVNVSEGDAVVSGDIILVVGQI